MGVFCPRCLLAAAEGAGLAYCFAGGLAGKLDDKFDGLFKRFGGYNKIMSSIGFRFATLSKRLWIPGGINFFADVNVFGRKREHPGKEKHPTLR